MKYGSLKIVNKLTRKLTGSYSRGQEKRQNKPDLNQPNGKAEAEACGQAEAVKMLLCILFSSRVRGQT